MNNAVALAAIGLVGTILAIVVKPLFSLLKANTKATSANTTALQSIAKETKQGNKEAKERNGHLAELVMDSRKATIEAINVKEQNVEHMHIEHEVIKK